MLPKFDLQILTEFGYTEMSACCTRALACCTRALAAKMTKFWLFPLGMAKSQ